VFTIALAVVYLLLLRSAQGAGVPAKTAEQVAPRLVA
jgi:hypothetical protein